MSYTEREILLIEDSPDDSELIQRALSSVPHKHTIAWVKNGQEALDYIFCEGPFSSRSPDEKPCLILLDLKLPKVNGLEVLEKIKSNSSTRTIPVVVISSSKEPKDLDKAYELGVNSYVLKPINYKDFMRATEQIGMYWLLVDEKVKSP